MLHTFQVIISLLPAELSGSEQCFSKHQQIMKQQHYLIKFFLPVVKPVVAFFAVQVELGVAVASNPVEHAVAIQDVVQVSVDAVALLGQEPLLAEHWVTADALAAQVSEDVPAEAPTDINFS